MITPHPKPPIADRRDIAGTPAQPRLNSSSPSTETTMLTMPTAAMMESGCHRRRKRRAITTYAATTASINANSTNAVSAA